MKKALLALILSVLATTAMAQAAPRNFVAMNRPAPSGFIFQDINDKEMSIDPYLGQSVMIINFWATWCPPCVKEMPGLEKLAATLDKNKYRVITIAVQNEKADITGFFKRQNITHLPTYMDPKMTGGRYFGLRGLPSTVIINSGGHIVGMVQGELDWAAPETIDWIKSIN